MEEECLDQRNDIFEQFLSQGNQNQNNSIELEKIEKPFHYRSSKNLIRRSNFRKILNTSSSN